MLRFLFPATLILIAGLSIWAMNVYGDASGAKVQGLNAAINLPEYTDLPPIMLASASGESHKDGTIDVPEGSSVSIDLPEMTPEPTLELGGKRITLEPDHQGRMTATMPISGGNTITLRQGWRQLVSWHIRILRDAPPRVDFVSDPMTYDHKKTRIFYEASDDYGLQSIVLRIQPSGPENDALNLGAVIPLDSPRTRHVKEVAVEDLTFLPWAGMPVKIQLEATDSAGNTALSSVKEVTLAKREFSHPLAKALIEERAKLLRQPDEPTRDEAANIMAGIARESSNYDNDPVVFMALRTGAVRLVLNRGDDVLPAVSRLMWQAAARIEDNMAQKSHDFLKQARHEKG